MSNLVVELSEGQQLAVKQLRSGNIVIGDTGSGKSRTAIAYYYYSNGGDKIVDFNNNTKPTKKLFIITEAKKRDGKEWEAECSPFGIEVVVNSWNNIKKYKDIKDAFFIFDEQRLTGTGAWVKTFYYISKYNKWILLSATPGDEWKDYMPVFIANGFYKNKTEFMNRHAVFSRFTKFPMIVKYLDTGRLMKLKQLITVDIIYVKQTKQHHIDVKVHHDRELYSSVMKDRWNIFENKPMKNSSELFRVIRKIVNTDPHRISEFERLVKEIPKVIVFYNYNYELEIIRDVLNKINKPFSEWNGHKHEEIKSKEPEWVYVVQYLAGANGWNCTLTNSMIFYSECGKYNKMHQASGRIDRRNTPFKELNYYHLISNASVDKRIRNAFKAGKDFNIRKFGECTR